MSQESAIEWTDATWNPVRGCTKISPGCKNCYAETFAERWRGIKGHAYEQGFDLRLAPDMLDKPLHWKKPRMIFVNSMSDLFHEDVPFEYIDQVFTTMCLAKWHTFQVLTKRAERMAEYFSTYRKSGIMPCLSSRFKDMPDGGTLCAPLNNVWLGVSVEDQKRADERIPHLLRTPAVVRFLSCQPLLGETDIAPWLYNDCDRAAMDNQFLSPLPGTEAAARFHSKIDWVIAGGESGHDARPMHPNWARLLRDQCREASVPFFFKQWGGANKKAAGRLLDGREWNEMPNTKAVPV